MVVSDSAALLSVKHAVAEHNGRWQTVLGEQKLLYTALVECARVCVCVCVCARTRVCFIACMLLFRDGNSIFVAQLELLKTCAALL
jgi:hypothetical protein